MSDVSIQMGQLKDYLRNCVQARNPVFVHGEPGTGKTANISELADDLNYLLITKVAAQMDASDISGCPMPDTGNGVTHFYRPAWLPTEESIKASGKDGAIIFWDELPNAATLVWNSVQKLINERILNDYVLPDNVAFVAAGNRVQDRAGANKLTSALASRFNHVTVDPDLLYWIQNFALRPIDDKGNTEIVPEMIAFFRYRPEAFHKFDKDQLSFPCARKWHRLSNIARTNPKAGIKLAQYSGEVGQAAAIEYLAYEKLYKELAATSIDAILLNPSKAPLPQKPDALYAIASALVRVATKDNFERVHTYLARMPKDYMFCAMNELFMVAPALQNTATFTKWTIANNAVLVGGK